MAIRTIKKWHNSKNNLAKNIQLSKPNVINTDRSYKNFEFIGLENKYVELDIFKRKFRIVFFPSSQFPMGNI